jgi:hypothetical protein
MEWFGSVPLAGSHWLEIGRQRIARWTGNEGQGDQIQPLTSQLHAEHAFYCLSFELHHSNFRYVSRVVLHLSFGIMHSTFSDQIQYDFRKPAGNR